MAEVGLDYISSRKKRRLDFYGGIALATLASPVMVAVGLETAIERRRLNPFYNQERIGRNGVPYKNYKFQSLRVRGAEPRLHGGYAHPDASPIGKVIRKTGLDETPQLLNVIKGDISLVGVRPVPQNYLEYYEMIAKGGLFDDWYTWYQLNPGLTGDGQLYANGLRDHDEAVITASMKIDIEACEVASFRNDLQTIGRTPVILFQRAIGIER